MPLASQSTLDAPAQRYRHLVAAALVLTGAALLLSRTKDYGLLGLDTYPIIASSRVRSLGDLVGNLTERLMDGRYPGGFYRPLLNLTFAADYAIWGLNPFGYQLTNALLLAGCAIAIYLMTLRLAGRDAPVAPLAALAFFLLWPLQVEVTPVPSRRPELLCGMFAALSVFFELSPRRVWPRRLPSFPSRPSRLSLPALPTLSARSGPPALPALPTQSAGSDQSALSAIPALPALPALPAQSDRSALSALPTLPVLPALMTLLAVASKETAFLFPAMNVLAVVLYAPERTPAKRCARAIVAALPHAAALLVMLAARVAVLHGLGGHETLRIGSLLSRFSVASRSILASLAFPQPVMRSASLAPWLVGGLLAGSLVYFAVALGTAGGHPEVSPKDRSIGKAAAVGFFWLALLTSGCVAAGRLEPWYLFLPGAAFSILVGLAADSFVLSIVRRPGAARLAALPPLLVLVGLAGWQASYSPLVRRYDEWGLATRASREYLDDLRGRLAAAPPGAVIRSRPLPAWVRPRGEGPQVYGAAVLADYSVQAWAEIVFPDRKIIVRPEAALPEAQPAQDEIVVLIPAPIKDS